MRYLFFILFSLILSSNSHAQLIENVTLINDAINIDSIKNLSKGRDEIQKYFFHIDSLNHLYDGIDTANVITRHGKITIFSKYCKGLKVKVEGYYENGNKYLESNFNDKGLNGWCIKYYQNGQKKTQTYYEGNKIVPPEIGWYDSGNIEFVDDINQISKTRKLTKWYNSGKLKEINTFLDTFTSPYNSGSVNLKIYYENGNIMEDVTYNADVQFYYSFYDNGKKKWEGKIENWAGSQLGSWSEWHKNGQLKRVYFFSDSIPNFRIGVWKWWDEKGRLQRKEYYSNGIIVKIEDFSTRRRKSISITK